MPGVTDEQWDLIRKHFPEGHIPDDRPGRKPIPARKVLEAVLWILNTGAQWHMLPQSYPNYKTVHRRFQQWCVNEVIRAALTELANVLRDQGSIDESECYIDATFASAKGGGDEIGPTRCGTGVTVMAIVDRHGLPLTQSTPRLLPCATEQLVYGLCMATKAISIEGDACALLGRGRDLSDPEHVAARYRLSRRISIVTLEEFAAGFPDPVALNEFVSPFRAVQPSRRLGENDAGTAGTALAYGVTPVARERAFSRVSRLDCLPF